ncbi:MAG: hypothetical protein WCQ91_06690 [Planctomycetota bacterium]
MTVPLPTLTTPVSTTFSVPVLPQRWHEIGYTIQKRKRREIHDAIRAAPRGRGG